MPFQIPLGSVVIRLCGETETQAAATFIQEEMFARYGSTPPLAGTTLLAYVDSVLVGTFGFDLCGPQHCFPFERFYHLTPEQDLPVPRCCQCFYYSRWVAVMQSVSLPLLYATTVAGLRQGKVFGWAVMKPGVVGVLRRAGVIASVRRTVFLPENLTARQGNYYTTVPMPQLYLLELEQVQTALEPKIRSLIVAEKLLLDF